LVASAGIASRPHCVEHIPRRTIELRSEREVYDSFLIVLYGQESYYVEVWNEPLFEREYT